MTTGTTDSVPSHLNGRPNTFWGYEGAAVLHSMKDTPYRLRTTIEPRTLCMGDMRHPNVMTRKEWFHLKINFSRFTYNFALQKIAMTTQRAAQFNNAGVVLVGSGQLLEALNTFRQALECIMGLLGTSRIPDKTLTSQLSSEIDFSRVSYSVPFPFNGKKQTSKHKLRGKKTSDLSEDTCSLLHTTPFIMDPRVGAYSEDCLLNTSVVSAIILFNLGVLYHLKSMEGHGSERKLIKARDLYEKSRILLADAGVSLSPTGNPVVDVLYMAIMNNLAQISYDLSSYDAARCYVYLLIEFALGIEPFLYASIQTAYVMESEKNRFLLMASLRHIPELAPAA